MGLNVYRNFFKPLMDRVAALLLLIILSPFILLTAILIFIFMGSPVFFTQKRPGFKGKIFTIYKFRTMTNAQDTNGNLLSDDKRLKGLGKWIRSLSLDELPQLWNVLKGDMSFIGPRPLLVEYLELYTLQQAKRHNVKPGITGLAQVSGRNAISWEEKFRYDIDYVENISFWLDMKILWMTVIKVFQRDGIAQKGEATMERFKGSRVKDIQ